MNLDEKLQALRTCAIRRMQQASRLADLADEIETIRAQGASGEYLKTVVKTQADYATFIMEHSYKTLDEDQNAILKSLCDE